MAKKMVTEHSSHESHSKTNDGSEYHSKTVTTSKRPKPPPMSEHAVALPEKPSGVTHLQHNDPRLHC